MDDPDSPWPVGTIFELIELMNENVFDNPVGTQVVLMEVEKPIITWRYGVIDQNYDKWLLSTSELRYFFKVVK